LPLAGEIPRTDAPAGLALARKGFRPFFLLAGLYATLILPVWLSALGGLTSPSRHFDAFSWHAHEMVFGFATAVIAGFLLTAVGNWTQRETVVGGPLLGLAAVWVAGRLAVAFLRGPLAAAVDLSFLPLFAVAIARPLVATKNRRNFVMLGVVAALWTANLFMHLDALGGVHGARRSAAIAAVDVVVVLVVLIAGRVVPMFTRNATGVTTVGSSPRLDVVAVVATAATAVLDGVAPAHAATSVVAGVAALATAARAVPWLTRKVLGVPLLWILHLSYAFVPIGLALRALGHPIATHALTVGAIGGATLGMMARVSLGHSGRPLEVGRPMIVSFSALLVAALVRVVGGLLPQALYRPSLYVAGSAWTLAFLVFVVVYAPIFASPRIDGKPG
jgi:uncharacterized protein involved in response to NO